MYKIKESKVEYKSKNAHDLVKEMRRDCFIYSESNKDFMEKSAIRFYNWDRSIINPSNEERFVDDLIRLNYLTIKN